MGLIQARAPAGHAYGGSGLFAASFIFDRLFPGMQVFHASITKQWMGRIKMFLQKRFRDPVGTLFFPRFSRQGMDGIGVLDLHPVLQVRCDGVHQKGCWKCPVFFPARIRLAVLIAGGDDIELDSVRIILSIESRVVRKQKGDGFAVKRIKERIKIIAEIDLGAWFVILPGIAGIPDGRLPFQKIFFKCSERVAAKRNV